MNNAELRAAIARAGESNQKIAAELGLSAQGFYNKLTGRSEFKGSEIRHLARLLNLTITDINAIFFNSDVN